MTERHSAAEHRPRLALVAFFGAALLAFVDSQKLPAAWALLAPALLSLLAGVTLPERLRAFFERAFRFVLLLSLLLGLAWTLYPALPQPIFDAGPRVLGLALAAFAGLFLLARLSAPRGVIPAGLGLLALGLLSPLQRAPLLPAGLATSALAVWATLSAPTLVPRGVALGTATALARTAAVLLAGGAFALGIVRLLPWAQPFVEHASAGWIDAGASAAPSAVASDSATLGELEQVALSQRVVMRVHASQPQKLRVRVLTRFDARGWHASKSTPRRPLLPAPAVMGLAGWSADIPGKLLAVPESDPQDAVAARALRSRVVLSATDAALAAPRGTRLVVLDATTNIDDNGILEAPSAPVEIYGIVNRRDLAELAVGDREALLALPGDTDKRLRELASQWSQGDPAPRLRVERTLNHLDRTCRYALDVGKFHSAQPVSEFVFEKKRGYCEYFASAAAVLLRLQGIPTRYVTGWNVSDDSESAGHFVVRESDAHAWIEAYLEGTGWVELDPTPAAQYAAVHAREQDGWRAVLEVALAASRELWVRVRAGDVASLAQWLARAWPIAALLGLLWAARLWKRRRRARPAAAPARTADLPPELRALAARIDAVLARHGYPRPPSRGLLEHEAALPPGALPPDLRESLRQAAAFLYGCVFGGAVVDAAGLLVMSRRLGRD